MDWVLGQMNFPTLWRSWIKTCVMSASASIILNGSPTSSFNLQKGLRQGDPLYPFLFNLAFELIQKAIFKRLWDGVEISRGGIKILNLQYADEIIIFFPKDMYSLMNIKKTLIIFHRASGLQVNFHKCNILRSNLDPSWLHLAAKSLQCKIGFFPIHISWTTNRR